MGVGGGGRVAVYARETAGFAPSAIEAKASAGAEWGSVFLGVPRTVAVSVAGQGTCDRSGPAVIPYGSTNVFTFSAVPVSLKTNGTEVTSAVTFVWINTGLWRGTLDDAAWTAKLSGSETLEAAFEALQCGYTATLPGGGMAVGVTGLTGWRYTLERRESLTEGDWVPVAGQTDILCTESGELLLTDDAVLPRAFYRVVSEAP